MRKCCNNAVKENCKCTPTVPLRNRRFKWISIDVADSGLPENDKILKEKVSFAEIVKKIATKIPKCKDVALMTVIKTISVPHWPR